MRIFGGRRRAREELARAAREARAQAERERDSLADAWLALELATPDAIRARYAERLDELDDELRPWGRGVAAWALRADGDPAPDGSFLGGAPGLRPDEPWPGLAGDPARFCVQLNLAALAPFAVAYRVDMPGNGLVQLFRTDGGHEIARHVPASDLGDLELRTEIPAGADERVRRSRRIVLYPEALVPWQECSHIVFRDGVDAPLPCTTSEELPGYSLGWWPFSRPDLGEWTFLAVCASRRELALGSGDEGFLWAAIPTRELAAGDFTGLTAASESA
jgi:hypothetical protein